MRLRVMTKILSVLPRVLVLQPNPYLIWRNDYFVAVKPGQAELWAWPGRPGATLRPATGPRTIVPVMIR